MRRSVIAGLTMMTFGASWADDGGRATASVFVHGSRIGYVTSLEPSPQIVRWSDGSTFRVPTPGTLLTTPSINVRTDRGYLVGIFVDSKNLLAPSQPAAAEGSIRWLGVLYDGTNCTGNTFFLAGGNPAAGTSAVGNVTPWAVREFGFVIGAPDPSDANGSYYVPRGATAQLTSAGSFQSRGPTGVVCTRFPNPSTPIATWPLLPNNPAVTGVPITLAGRVTLVARDDD